jgi:hypothetical protein
MHFASTEEGEDRLRGVPGSSMTEKSTVVPSILGGVPVFSRPTGNFISRSLAARATEAGSPARPAR